MTCVLGGVEHLRELMARMASTTLEVLEDTCSLFGQGDLEARRALWGRIDELSRELKELRRTLVNEVLTFMVKYQPLGRELRTSQTLIGIAYDVYRISRYCREIARIDLMLSHRGGVSAIEGALGLFEAALSASRMALADLRELRPARLRDVMAIDAFIDGKYAEALREVAEADVVESGKALKLLIMRHVERLTDHAQYIERYIEELLE